MLFSINLRVTSFRVYFAVEYMCVLCSKGKLYRFFCEMEQNNHDNFDSDVYIL